jgi:hypothetical protein
MGDMHVDSRIMLKLILKKWDVGMVDYSVGFCEHGGEF